MPGPATTDGDFYGRSDAGPLPLHAQLGAEPDGRGLVARPRYRPGVRMRGVGVGRLTWTSSHLSYGASGTWPVAQAIVQAKPTNMATSTTSQRPTGTRCRLRKGRFRCHRGSIPARAARAMGRMLGTLHH